MLRGIFLPNKRNLLAWVTILFISSPILVSIWQKDVVTNDISWPAWRNIAMGLFWSLNVVGSFLQAPFFFVYGLFPAPHNPQLDTIFSFIGIVLNSYVLASLINVVWHAYKKRELSKKNLLLYFSIWLIYIITAFIAYFINAQFIVLVAIVVIATLLTLRFSEYPKKLFTAICILTILFSLGALGQTIDDFEENYCWAMGTKADPTGSKMENGVGVAYQAHMDCHKTFNLITTLEEKYQFSK